MRLAFYWCSAIEATVRGVADGFTSWRKKKAPAVSFPAPRFPVSEELPPGPGADQQAPGARAPGSLLGGVAVWSRGTGQLGLSTAANSG